MPKSKNRGHSAKKDRASRRQQKHLGEHEDFGVQPITKRAATKPLSAKTEAQGQLISSIISNDITFAIGPAGTGKTYVTAGLAAEKLHSGEIEQLIITRPMQDCGEEMGFLPGELEEKYEPWIEPVIDVLNDRLGESYVKYLRKAGRISAKPLQFMRGKSFQNTWVIMDEAQNVSPTQMKMFLTRIGESSKLIIDGDEKQSDLKTYRGESVESGLQRAIKRLKGVPQIGFVEFTEDDIVRHGIIREILTRY